MNQCGNIRLPGYKMFLNERNTRKKKQYIYIYVYKMYIFSRILCVLSLFLFVGSVVGNRCFFGVINNNVISIRRRFFFFSLSWFFFGRSCTHTGAYVDDETLGTSTGDHKFFNGKEMPSFVEPYSNYIWEGKKSRNLFIL